MHPTKKNTRYQVLYRYIERLESFIVQLEMIDRRYFWVRLSILILGLLGIVLIFIDGFTQVGIGLLILSIVSFITVVFFHRRLDASLLRFRTVRAMTKIQLSRMRLEWDAIPVLPKKNVDSRGAVSNKPNHPYEKDLEITGKRSLQQLIDVTVTTGGSERLRTWLLNDSPSLEQIHSRQTILHELQPLTGFRGRLRLNSALASDSKGERWNDAVLLRWLEGHSADNSLKGYLILLLFLVLVNIILFLMSMLGGYPPFWVFSLGLYAILYNMKYRQYRHLFGDAYELGRNLDQFRSIFLYLEKYPYPEKGSLKDVCQHFYNTETQPSRYLRRISTIISAASLQNNMFLWLFINALLPWDLYFTIRLQEFRQEVKELLPLWLDAWYELEALNSLANFAYLNPDYIYPIVFSDGVGPRGSVFDARQLGHPLLLDDVRICNNFTLDNLGQVVIVTGSNMSGKSTFLKTLGVNLCLAYAGGPVNAVSMQTALFRLNTAINVTDSLTDGISYFYAEVKRLKALLDAYQEGNYLPVFFLIDEIFRGTNNKERHIGSRAYVRALVGGRGTGVISTHDLTLVHLESDSEHVQNYHFREQVLDGRMVFDYKLHPGPCPTTNALKIMELEGLPVD